MRTRKEVIRDIDQSLAVCQGCEYRMEAWREKRRDTLRECLTLCAVGIKLKSLGAELGEITREERKNRTKRTTKKIIVR